MPAYRYGGPLHVAHSISKALVKTGHQVTVCTTNQQDETKDLSVQVDVPLDVDGVTVFYEPVVLSRYWGLSPQLYRRIASEIYKSDVVLIHAHYQFANWIGAVLARKAGKPYVIFSHGSLHTSGINHKSTVAKKLYLTLLEKKNFSKALFIAFNAPEEQESSLFRENGKVIPNGIDPVVLDDMPTSGQFRELFPQLRNKRYLLFLGRIDVQHKGLDLLIPAVSRLVKSFPDLHLVIAGPDEDGGVDEVKKLVQWHDLTSSVTLTGLITGQTKVAALREADFFVMSSRFEGMSIALLEALYIGLPLLVTNQIGLCREIKLAGAGVVVSPNEESIYEGLCQLMEPTVYSSIRGKGTILIRQNYTWDSITENLLQQISKSLLEYGYQAH